MERGSGILMHISSLPNDYGIGTFGKEAYAFVDFLAEAKQKYWQILPLCPTGFGDSPYQSTSSFALNPYFINLEKLEEQGLLQPGDYRDMDFGRDPGHVDYFEVYVNREAALRKAFAQRGLLSAQDMEAFRQEHLDWLEDYALYMAVKKRFGGRPWESWDEDIRRRTPEALAYYRELYREDILYFQFIQYIAYMQWDSLKSYSNRQGIQIIGDIPIYASADSADTWSHASEGIFQYDRDLTPACVAGCPPDYFSEDGQYWGNTVYDWDRNRETGYDWWIRRLGHALSNYDWVRIDHFRGFESYWEVPYGSPTAAAGSWKPGPGMDFVSTLKNALGNVKIIAEDLGARTESLKIFLEESGFPGMKVLGFAFDVPGDNEHLPHNYDKNCVVYTGTHDNDTAEGWLAKASTEQAAFAKKYLRPDESEGFYWAMIRGAMSSAAFLSVVPMQDLLGLGSEARMNTPATLGGTNWQWRMRPGAASPGLAQKIAEITQLYGRG
ncbi:MAG TPA: 4-alpha-glucanotransferase [Anaerovoracaceae bacterium]|nr:4-alpha-glucanotransferase [Anaerovoracaceae bacterium]